MLRLNNRKKILIKEVSIAVALAITCFLFQHSFEALRMIVSYPIKFEMLPGGKSWLADVSKLENGDYYISAGIPKMPCDLFADKFKLNSTRSEIAGIQDGLLLGSTLLIDPQHHVKNISLVCQKQSGFTGLMHEPVIARHFWGLILQGWRALIDLFLGPIASLLILLSLLIGHKKTTQSDSFTGSESSPFEGWRYKMFSVVSSSYAFSLALFPRLFISGMSATILHVFFRNFFSLSVLNLFFTLGKRHKWLFGIQTTLLTLVPLWGIFSPDNFVFFYRLQFTFFPIASAIIAFDLFLNEPKSKSLVLLRRIMLAWVIMQTLDLVANWTDFGAYTAPAVILLLSLSAMYIRHLERLNSASIEDAAGNILRIIETNTPIQNVLQEVAAIAMKETKFGRVSAYVDGFCLGAAESPGKSFFRVGEAGYKKETWLNSVIIFSEGRGDVMAEAHKLQQPILRTGYVDNAWFLVVPIGNYAFINLSDDSPKSNFLAYESLEIVQRILPSLKSLERRLVDIGFYQGAALQKLRSKRGDGKWEEEFGAIFVDLNDYSQLADVLGRPFTEFTADVYIPAIIKAVSKFAVSEHVAGDEIYFIVTKDTLTNEITLRDAVMETLILIDKFVFNEGSELCSSAGFSPLTTSVGINVGLGTIVSDPVSVRTTGQMVNFAKRLQEEAGKSGILIAANSNIDIGNTHYFEGERILIQKKKQVVLGIKLLRKQNFKKNNAIGAA